MMNINIIIIIMIILNLNSDIHSSIIVLYIDNNNIIDLNISKGLYFEMIYKHNIRLTK